MKKISLFKPLLKAKAVLGLDIGTSTIKAVLLKVTKEEVELANAGMVELHLDPAIENKEKRARVIEGIKRLLKENEIKVKEVVIAVPGQSVIIRHLKLPSGARERLDQVIKFEAQNQIPFPLDRVGMDYQALPGKEGEEVKVILAAMKRELIDDHLALVEEAELRCEAINISSLALYNALRFKRPSKEAEVVALIDIGATTTDISIHRDGILEFTRSAPVAGNDLTEAIQTKLGVSFSEAEKLKREEGDEVASALSPVLENLFAEIRRSLNYYRSQPEGAEITRVILSGGSAGLKNLDKFLSQRLGVPVEIADPLSQVKYDSTIFKLKEILPSFSVAVGLALRAIGLGEVRISLLPQVVREKALIQVRKRNLLVAAGLGVAIIIFGGLLFLQRLQQREARLVQVEAELEKIKEIVPKVEKLKREKVAVEKRMMVIEGLLLERARWLNVLLEMTRVFPSSVWIQSLSLPAKESASISAQASSVEAVSDLMVSLKNSPYFEEINLGSVSTPKEGEAVSFPMNWKIKRVVERMEEKPVTAEAQREKPAEGAEKKGLREKLKEREEELEE